MELDDILIENDRRIIKASETASKDLIAALRKLFLENAIVLNGNDNATLLAVQRLFPEIERVINATIQTSPYPEAVRAVINGVANVDRATVTEMVKYGGWPESVSIATQTAEKQIFINTLTSQLNSTLSSSIITEVQNTLVANIRTGATTSETSKFLSQLLLKQPGQEYGRIARYSTQIVNDAILGYQGMVLDNFAKEYGVTEYRYVGSIITDSRPFCTHVIGKLNGVIPAKELPALLNEFLSSKSKRAGMRPGTNKDNFLVYRGGYRCRHRAIPVYLNND